MLRGFCLMLLSLLPAAACIWDRDTWREEARGRIDTLKAITGWFDRYPPRYYVMRLERVTKELVVRPAALDLYDDAGVACNRLGRYDEAIAWMAKKRAVLDEMPAKNLSMDRYRYHANLGSFLGNRWATRPPEERNGDLSDLIEATSHITTAIELNPEAHFGREKYQLKLFQWLQEPDGANLEPNFLGLSGDKQTEPGGLLRYPELKDAEAGLAGLIHLGSAWESIDVFSALQGVVQADGASSLAYITGRRIRELTDEGHESLHPAEKLGWIDRGHYVRDPQQLDEWYAQARIAAEKREIAWVAYQSERFDRGTHPDTDSRFWDQWKEPDFPRLPKSPLTIEEKIGRFIAAVAGLTVAVIVTLIGWRWRKSKKRSVLAST